MKKALGLVAPVLILSLIVWAYFSRDTSVETTPREHLPPKEEVSPTPGPQAPTPEPTPEDVKEVVKKPQNEISRAEERWQERKKIIEEEIKRYEELSKQCQSDLEELFEGHNYGDPRSDFYKEDEEKALKFLLAIYSSALMAYDPMTAYNGLKLSVEEGLPVPIDKVNEYMAKMNGCLNPKIESYLMTLFEAMEIHGYSEETRNQLRGYVLEYVIQAPQTSAPTLLSLSFKINVLSGMASYGLIPARYYQKLQELERQLMESHASLSEALFDEENNLDEQDKREELYSNFRSRERILSEIYSLINDVD